MTSKYRKRFPDKHALLPVIHIVTPHLMRANAEMAIEFGADGVFVIDHMNRQPEFLNHAVEDLKRRHPGFWVAPNFLNLFHQESLGVVTPAADGLWVDQAGMLEKEQVPAVWAKVFDQLRQQTPARDMIYFGGVAFKGQAPVKDPARLAKLAVPFIDVITTSGKGTGFAPDLDKIKSMKEAIGDHPLANASGMAPGNIEKFMPYVDAFLVSTGISFPGTDKFDPARLRAVAQALGKSPR